MLLSTDPERIQDLLPDNLRRLLGSSKDWTQVGIGKSGDICFRVKIQTNRDAFLKFHTGNQKKYFEHEVEACKWLHSLGFVPDILGFGRNQQHHFLLSSAVPGKDLAHSLGELAPDEIVRICAQSMRSLHKVSIEACPFDQRNSIKVERAIERAKAGLVMLSDLDPSRKGWSLEQLTCELTQKIPKSEDLVFTHGDFCLPNIISNGNSFTGFIDLGRCGIADRYQDIALCLRSLNANLGNSCRDLFLKYYDPSMKLDEHKVFFYELLDEFF